MAAETHTKGTDFEWKAPELFISALAGIVAVGGIWIFTELLARLFT